MVGDTIQLHRDPYQSPHCSLAKAAPFYFYLHDMLNKVMNWRGRLRWWRLQCRLKATFSYHFSSSSVHYSDVYCQYPDRCRSLSFFLTYFLSFYLSRFSFYINTVKSKTFYISYRTLYTHKLRERKVKQWVSGRF